MCTLTAGTLNLNLPWKGKKIIALGQDPGERQLARGNVLLLCEPGNLLDELEILVEIFSHKEGNLKQQDQLPGRHIFQVGFYTAFLISPSPKSSGLV